jgi:phosphate transport system permease protein
MTSLDQVTGAGAPTAADPAEPRTTVPSRPVAHSEPPRRELAPIRSTDVIAVFASLAAAAATTGLLWSQLAPFTGLIGYVVVTWCLFVVIYRLVVSFDTDRPAVRDRVSAVIVNSLAVVVAAALVWVIFSTFIKGWDALVHLNFYTHDLHLTVPNAPLTQGGVLHAIVGTLIEVAIAIAIAVPLGLLAAVFLQEVPGPLARLVRTVVQAMTALPDVLAGLFVYATLIVILGLGYSGLAAGCALSVTAMPIICRAADVVLRLVPGGLTEASYALGAGQWRTVLFVKLPTARSGLATAVILGTARAIGETAPVLLTAGYTLYLNFNPAHNPMASLPLLAFEEVSSGQTRDVVRGFGAASVLLVLVLLLFALMRVIGGRGPGQLTRRQQRRRAARSRRDLAAYARRAPIAQPADEVTEYSGDSP